MFSNKEQFYDTFMRTLEVHFGVSLEESTDLEKYKALGIMIREYISRNWIATGNTYEEQQVKQVYYFSMEFLPGKFLGQNLLNLGIYDQCQQWLEELGINLADLENQEPDAGLGNGGLGRLAACFLDSIASMELPGHGMGLRYKYGLFDQKIVDGHQMEYPDFWLKEGTVWEYRRSDEAVEIRFGGHVWLEHQGDRFVCHHEHYDAVHAVPYDIPMIGYKNNTVNTLRLWSSEPISRVAHGVSPVLDSIHKVIESRRSAEIITEFLYPDDTYFEGKVLRLKQQYFLASAGIKNIVNNYKKLGLPIEDFPQKVTIHLNDTHPVVAIPELMRILLDEEGLGWDEAWKIVHGTFAYTNHTILFEALETWSIDLFQNLLPRIFMIVKEINERFCQDLWNRYPGNWDKIHRMAIMADGHIKMAHLALVASYSVNGVARLHTEILKSREMREFYENFPEKFNNKTNGITHRRWLIKSNPGLTAVISEAIGEKWKSHPLELKNLNFFAKNPAFQEQVELIKLKNKEVLASHILNHYGVKLDPYSIFDVQIKRLHAYKRQLLNGLHILYLYLALQENPNLDIYPRTFLFGAKAAPGYYLAKCIIKFIHDVAKMVNEDPRVSDKIKVVFLENYRVSLAEKIIPAADVSEQISTAGKEASGTGNMKLMMNGALTIGTMDGANVEIFDAVGSDNMFVFGMSSSEVMNYEMFGGYNAWEMYHHDLRIKKVLDFLIDYASSKRQMEYESIYHNLLMDNDDYFVLKDFSSYVAAQEKVDLAFRDRRRWMEMSIRNIAESGIFSSDRTISQYAGEIWGIDSIPIL